MKFLIESAVGVAGVLLPVQRARRGGRSPAHVPAAPQPCGAVPVISTVPPCSRAEPGGSSSEGVGEGQAFSKVTYKYLDLGSWKTQGCFSRCLSPTKTLKCKPPAPAFVILLLDSQAGLLCVRRWA